MPRTQQNLAMLRDTLSQILGNQKGRYTDTQIPELLFMLGLDDCTEYSSKRQHLQKSVEAANDAQRVAAAHKALELIDFPVLERDQLQELVWDDGTVPVIPGRYRRELAKALITTDLYMDRAGFEQVLSEFWRLDMMSVMDFTWSSPTLREEIVRHYIEKPDWDSVTLLDKIGAFQSSHARFGRFIEALASSRVLPSEPAQRKFIEIVNSALRECGVHVVIGVGEDAFLTATLATIGSRKQSSPKNLIFASTKKPDLRLGNALDNDIEVMSDPTDVLIYDRPIASSGLLWRDLQTWYSQTYDIEESQAKSRLYRRLKACLPKSSPPQELAFESFFKAFTTAIPELPALLPEVWFHWDPQTISQRGKEALLRSRMDFLLLLPGGVRVVIEIDGKHHYSDPEGLASPKRYAEMMMADRVLRLAGYEVYRFGAHELGLPDAEEMLIGFYRSLFERYSLRPAS
ncbi:MAG: AbiJ-related protein [Pseudomonadales bacterium]